MTRHFRRPSPWEPERQYDTPPRHEAKAFLQREAMVCLDRCRMGLEAMGCDESLMDKEAHAFISDSLFEAFYKTLEACDDERSAD